MTNIRAFDNAEDMFAAIAADRKAADARIADWQKAVAPGDKIIRIAEAGPELIVIYGVILDVLAEERPLYNLKDPEEAMEFAAIQNHYGPEWYASFRFGRFYSPLCPEGELGDIHLSTICGILTPEEFSAAEQKGWPQAADPTVRNVIVRRHLRCPRSPN